MKLSKKAIKELRKDFLCSKENVDNLFDTLEALYADIKGYREGEKLRQEKGTAVEAHLRAKVAYATGTIKSVRDSGHCPVSMQNALDFLEEGGE